MKRYQAKGMIRYHGVHKRSRIHEVGVGMASTEVGERSGIDAATAAAAAAAG